jgi:hypothetical protein
MGIVKTRRRVARALAVATVAGCLGVASPALASEVTVGGDGEDPCDMHATVWWNVPPEPGQQMVGFEAGAGCIYWDPPVDPPIHWHVEELPPIG